MPRLPSGARGDPAGLRRAEQCSKERGGVKRRAGAIRLSYRVV
jgi:hypothetical protein